MNQNVRGWNYKAASGFVENGLLRNGEASLQAPLHRCG